MLTRKILNFLIDPSVLVFKLWKAFPKGSFGLRLEYDIFPRPHYAFCLFYAARQAQRLAIPRISAIEFGVAGGSGLIELEHLAKQIEALTGVGIDLYGFDSGEGLPDPVDYRDLPYIWKSGFYKMDQAALRSKLSQAKLVLGDVKDTVPGFWDDETRAPLGAAFFDLDFWSSTRDSLDIFSSSGKNCLPRTFCYFDDVHSSLDGGLLNEYVGQPLAINDYNSESKGKKIAEIMGFSATRKRTAAWHSKIFVHHDFDHPEYDTYLHADTNRQLPI